MKEFRKTLWDAKWNILKYLSIVIIVGVLISIEVHFIKVKEDARNKINLELTNTLKEFGENAYSHGQRDAISGDIRYDVAYDCWIRSPWDETPIKLAGTIKMCKDIK